MLTFAANIEQSLTKQSVRDRTLLRRASTHHACFRCTLLTLKEDRVASTALFALLFRVWELHIPSVSKNFAARVH